MSLPPFITTTFEVYLPQAAGAVKAQRGDLPARSATAEPISVMLHG